MLRSIFERTFMSSLCTCLRQRRKSRRFLLRILCHIRYVSPSNSIQKVGKDTSKHILEVSERKMIEIDTDKESETESSRFRLKRETCMQRRKETCMHEKANTSVKAHSLEARKRVCTRKPTLQFKRIRSRRRNVHAH